MRLLLQLAFVSLVNTGCHALEKNLNQQVPWTVILDSSTNLSGQPLFQPNLEDQAKSAQGLIYDHSSQLKTNANIIQNELKHSSSKDIMKTRKRSRNFVEDLSTSSEPLRQATNWHDVSHHQVNGFLYSNHGQVASTVSSNPEMIAPDDQRNFPKNVNSRDREVPFSSFESPSNQGSQGPLGAFSEHLLSDEQISNVDSHRSSMLFDEFRTLLETPDLPNEKDSETARSAEAPIPNSLKSQNLKSGNELSLQNFVFPHARNVPEVSIQPKPIKLQKAQGFKTYITSFTTSQLGIKVPETTSPLAFNTQITDFRHIFEFCEDNPDTLIGYFDTKYKNVLIAPLKNFSDRKASGIFFTYLLFVEMINEISPRYNVADVGIDSACQSFIIQHQFLKQRYLELAKDIKSWHNRLTVAKVDLIWCYLKGWMIDHGSSLIDRFTTAENPGFLPDDFQSFLNHIFVLKFGKLGNESDQSSLRHSHVQKYSSYHDSAPSYQNDISLPIQSQPLPPLSSSTTELERKSSKMSEPSPIKFFEKELELNSDVTYWDPLLSTLREDKRFPLVLDDGNALKELACDIDTRKRHFNTHKKSNTLTQSQKTPQVDQDRSTMIKEAYSFYEKNLKTWFRYFDQRFKLGTELYYEDLAHRKSKDIFPTYLFFVEMINQIVPGENSANGGMLSACYYFEKLLKFYANPASQVENPTFWKLTHKKIVNHSKPLMKTLLWHFLEYWLINDRPHLSLQLSQAPDSSEMNLNVKGLFNDIFSFCCVPLTQNLKEKNYSLEPKTAPSLFKGHNDSQPEKMNP